MIVRNVTIENFGAFHHFTCDLTDGVNMIRTREADAISYAIRLLLNSRELPPLPPTWLRADTRIHARISAGEKDYHVTAAPHTVREDLMLCIRDDNGSDVTEEYLYLTSHCAEHDLSEIFENHAKDGLLRFLKYVSEDQYFSPRELSTRTNGLSDLKIFRSYLLSYVKNFKPELIRDGKRYELVLGKDGRYDVTYANGKHTPVFLSDTEKTLFRYLCFLRTAEFWHGFEEIRNMHGIKKPLLIKNFLERLDESVNVDHIMDRTMRLGRQVFLLTPRDRILSSTIDEAHTHITGR